MQPAQALPRCTKLTAQPSTASVPITVLLYNGLLLCDFDVAIKGLNEVDEVKRIKCNSPPIDGQCTNFILFDVAL